MDRLPAEDPADPVFLARLLLGALQGLGALHQEGRVHGGPLAVHLVEPVQRSGGAAGCCRLLWLDSFGVTRRPADDMAELGRLVRDLTPGEAGPLAQLVTTWDQNPPASAEDAMALVRQALAARLLDERHRLARLSRSTLRRRQIMRLYRLVEELQQVVPPPAGRVCLRAGIDGVLVLAESDGARVGGGISPDPATRFVPTIYGPDRGLDAQRGRQLLRAWALRDRGDEELRTQVQDQIGGTDQQAERLVRWLSTMARLRATRLMLGAQGGVSRPVPVASDYSTDRVNR
ncbi:MAG: hypothetical protein QGG40_21200 [Myxococcota bacterium]|nr:hypothetical protein [Myxococcota bacterium]